LSRDIPRMLTPGGVRYISPSRDLSMPMLLFDGEFIGTREQDKRLSGLFAAAEQRQERMRVIESRCGILCSGDCGQSPESRDTVIESRCGILCSGCGYRASMGCGGCIAIKRPFWGEICPLKTCCEAKGLENCGRCGEFPCEVLVQFAFDEQQGDGGRRIEQCRAWSLQ